MSTPKPAGLERIIGLWSAVAVVVGSTIGSGIFRSPADVAKELPDPWWMLSAWVVGGLFALCGALTLAEVGGAFPYTGGLYVFIRKAYGRPLAFLFGWAQLVLIRPAAIGAVAITFGEYTLRVANLPEGSADFARGSTLVAIGAIAVVSMFNFRGVLWGASAQNLTTLGKVLGLLLVAIVALALGLPKTGGNFAGTAAGEFSMAAFGIALVGTLWAYDGWSDVVYVAGEVRDGRRNVPRAILIGTCGVIGIYLLANVAYLSVLSVGEIAASPLVAAEVAERLVGGWGVIFVGVTVMVSTFGTLNGSMLTSPRIFFALAEDGLFFRKIGEVHPRFHTPYASILLTMGLSIVFVSIGQFKQLTDAFVTALLPFYGLGVGSVFLFRARESKRARSGVNPPGAGEVPSDVTEIADEERVSDRTPYSPTVRTPLYPAVPLLFVLSTLFLLGNALWKESSRWQTLGVFGIILVGLPVYWATVGRRSRS